MILCWVLPLYQVSFSTLGIRSLFFLALTKQPISLGGYGHFKKQEEPRVKLKAAAGDY